MRRSAVDGAAADRLGYLSHLQAYGHCAQRLDGFALHRAGNTYLLALDVGDGVERGACVQAARRRANTAIGKNSSFPLIFPALTSREKIENFSLVVCAWANQPWARPSAAIRHAVSMRLVVFMLLVSSFMFAQSSAMVFLSTPTLSISISTVSPGFIHKGGVRLAPTPPGVPVTMTSPGNSWVKAEM